MNKYLVMLIISLCLFVVSNSADGFQSSKNQDVPVELMPKKQKDLLGQYVDIKNKIYKNQENTTINRVLKKETATGLAKDLKDFINSTNEDISNNGIKDWVGTVVINSSTVGFYVYANSKQLVHFTISTSGMNKEVLDTVKTLATGNLVKFSIESTKPWYFQQGGSQNTYLYIMVNPPSNLKSLVLIK